MRCPRCGKPTSAPGHDVPALDAGAWCEGSDACLDAQTKPDNQANHVRKMLAAARAKDFDGIAVTLATDARTPGDARIYDGLVAASMAARSLDTAVTLVHLGERIAVKPADDVFELAMAYFDRGAKLFAAPDQASAK